jgi:hypothetical protein
MKKKMAKYENNRQSLALCESAEKRRRKERKLKCANGVIIKSMKKSRRK